MHRRRKGPPKGGNVSIVVTDIEGYSGVWERAREGRVQFLSMCVSRRGAALRRGASDGGAGQSEVSAS